MTSVIKKLLLVLFFSFVAFLYVKNITHDIYGGDVGDFVSAAYVLGVPHAPGYPLFTLFGYVLTHLPISFPPVSKMALLSVISSLLCLFFYYKLSYKATKDFIISLLSTCILGFSFLFWLYTEIPEVFALNNLFAVLLFYLGVEYYKHRDNKTLYFLSFITGLSLAHQHTIVLIFPSIVLLLFYTNIKRLLNNRKVIIRSFMLFFAGLLPYAYVPLAASKHPVISWDNAYTLENFIRLILRKDYGTFNLIQSPLPTVTRVYILKDYAITFITSLTPPVIVICLLGIWYLFRKDKKILLVIFIAFLLSGPIFNVYAGTPVVNSFLLGLSERFYLLSMVIYLLFLPYGFLFIQQFLQSFFSKKIYVYVVILEFFLIPFILLRQNAPKTDLSKTNIGNNLAIDTLSTLSQNSIVFVSGDTHTFNLWYVQQVLRKRKDVVIVHVFGAGNDEYLQQVQKEFLKKHPKAKSKEIADGMLQEELRKRPVFSLVPIETTSKDIEWIPVGLVFTLVKKEDIPPLDEYLVLVKKNWAPYHVPIYNKLVSSERNFILSDIPRIYSTSLLSIGDFLVRYYNSPRDALEFYHQALIVDGENSKAYESMGIIEYQLKKSCKNSLENLQKALSLSPGQQQYYLSLYILHKECKSSKLVLNELKTRYYALFNHSIEEEIERFSREHKITSDK